MTIPMVVMVVSAALWLVLELARPANGPVSSLVPWLIEVCRILFAASALVVLWHVAAKTVF